MRFPFRGMTGPEILTLSTLLVLGPLLCLAIPLGAGWDEETHVIRAWEIASLHFIPNELPRNELPFPAIFWDLSYRRPFLIRPVEPDFWSANAELPIGAFGYIYSGLETRSVYSPPLLLPHALVIRYLGHSLELPALPVFYAARLLGLLSYTFLAWLAVRIAPFGKWTLALVAIAPTAVFQASTVSADPISNGLGLLFVAGTLSISVRPSLGWRQWGVLLLLAAALFVAKPNSALLALLPFLAIRPTQFQMKRGYALLAIGTLLLGLIEVGGWTLLAYPRAGIGVGEGEPIGQLAYIAGHPLAFFVTILTNLVQNGFSYLGQWMAEFGYEYWSVPLPTYLLYSSALVAAITADSSRAWPSSRTRAGLWLVFGIGVIGTLLSLYLVVTPVGAGEILGIQGRYFAAIIPLALLAVVGARSFSRRPEAARLAVGLAVAGLAVYGSGLLLSYHVPCGSAFYEPGLCYQPVYKNWAPDARYSPAISSSMSLAQQIAPECDGATEVVVWVDSSRAAGDGVTEFVLSESGTGRELARQSARNSMFPTGDRYSIGFEADWQSASKVYWLRIQTAAGSNSIGPRIGYTLQPEYEAGQLFEAGKPMDVDLVFKYGCISGIEKLFRQETRGGRP